MYRNDTGAQSLIEKDSSSKKIARKNENETNEQGKLRKAIKNLEKAKIAEDKLGYSGEPPDYLQPIRHTLGAVYLKAGRLEEAEQAYREDLAEFPENGWSLYGLSRVLEAQGRADEAAEVEDAFRLAWADADGPITTSCECIPEL